MIGARKPIAVSIMVGLDSLTAPGAFRRYGPMYILFEVLLLTVAALFWLSAWQPGAAFSPETWGAWACQFPALLWAGCMLAGGWITSMGLIHPANRWQIIVGGAIQTAVFTALSLSATLTGGQDVVGAVALIMFVPFHLLVITGAVRHGAR